jgi:hypothetical protein
LPGSGHFGSVERQNQYEIHTTPLAAGPRGFNWVMYFGKQLPVAVSLLSTMESTKSSQIAGPTMSHT